MLLLLMELHPRKRPQLFALPGRLEYSMCEKGLSCLLSQGDLNTLCVPEYVYVLFFTLQNSRDLPQATRWKLTADRGSHSSILRLLCNFRYRSNKLLSRHPSRCTALTDPSE